MPRLKMTDQKWYNDSFSVFSKEIFKMFSFESSSLGDICAEI